MPERTIITYDNGGSMGGALLFEDFSKKDCQEAIDAKQEDMERVISALQELFYGEISNIQLMIVDKLTNTEYIHGPLALELDYYLSPKDLRYIKSLDDTLIIIV